MLLVMSSRLRLLACQVDINLVASVGDECYLALDKGPITPQHSLVIPIEHYPSWAARPAPAAAEAGRCVRASGRARARAYAAAMPRALSMLSMLSSFVWCVACALARSRRCACRYLSALRAAFASAGQALVGFERHLKLRSKGGNHTHINTLGVSKAAGAPRACCGRALLPCSRACCSARLCAAAQANPAARPPSLSPACPL